MIFEEVSVMNPGKNFKSDVEILIVEDSATQRGRLQHLLEEHGFAVAVAINGRQGLEAARRRKPTLIISDIVMPELDGYGMCKALRGDESLKDIPVILLTSLSDARDVILGLECGADNFIRKPYQADFLLQRVDYLLMNLNLRRHEKMRMGIEISLGGHRHFITSERQQILDLLISTYEQATYINNELALREGELAHSNQVLNGLYGIAKGLNRATSEQQVTEIALERAIALPGVEAGWILLREAESGCRLAAARNLPPALQTPGAMEGSCMCQRRLLAGKLDSVVMLECERLGNTTGDTEGLRYHAVIPLWVGDRNLLGVMNLVGPQGGMFDDEELKILYGVGNQVAAALERARLHEHLEQLVEQRTAALTAEIEERTRSEARVKRLNRVYAVLSGINTTIVRTRERKTLFDEVCRIAVELGGFPKAWIGLFDANGLDITSTAQSITQTTAQDEMPDNCVQQAAALHQNDPVICNDIETDARMLRWGDWALQRGFHSLVVLPLYQEGKKVGALMLYGSEKNLFDDGEMKLLVEVAEDISFALDHIEKTERVNYLAYYDAITGLPNRTLFQDRLGEHLRVAHRGMKKLAVCIFDVERFKNVNDTMGRRVGDILLRQIAERASCAAGGQERVARIGADSFAVLFLDVHKEHDAARQLERKLQACFATPFTIDRHEFRVSAKAGLAMFPIDATEGEALFANAEVAWKRAKESGERYLFYTQRMTDTVVKNFSLENKLRMALEKNEFVLHYQPKVNLDTLHIEGVEALIRWQSPELGLVPPIEFIPLLEETGLILDVGAWALQRAVKDHREWVAKGLAAPRIAVNVSANQLRHSDFVNEIIKAIGRETTSPAIDLELTESLLMTDMQGNIEKLNTLRGLGMRIAIDDFGTGHSSLAYLSTLPVDTIKIDRSFIITMQDKPGAMTLVQMIISLAHSLDLFVVAEGVESEEQAGILRHMKCDQMQGYLFSKPLPMAEMTALLGRTPS